MTQKGQLKAYTRPKIILIFWPELDMTIRTQLFEGAKLGSLFVGRHLEFQNGRLIWHVFAYNFETKADWNMILVPTPTLLGSRNPA